MTKLFLSYGRRDAAELASRLHAALEELFYDVWQDTNTLVRCKACTTKFVVCIGPWLAKSRTRQ